MTDLLQQILAADDLKHEDVVVPEWGDITVRVTGLTGRQRDRFEASLRAERPDGSTDTDTDNIRAKLVARTMVDPETGARIIPDNQINALGEKSGAVLDRLFDVARNLSGMTDESAEEIKGNSEAGESDSSTSASPATSTEQ